MTTPPLTHTVEGLMALVESFGDITLLHAIGKAAEFKRQKALEDVQSYAMWLVDATAVDAAAEALKAEPAKLWLWRNFVDGRPEYWAFDNPFPVQLDYGDPQTIGEPCGYAIFKPSRVGRTDVSEAEVIRRINAAKP